MLIPTQVSYEGALDFFILNIILSRMLACCICKQQTLSGNIESVSFIALHCAMIYFCTVCSHLRVISDTYADVLIQSFTVSD
jgi:hypothetical protein